jgi:hypothetical protein
MNTKEWNRLLDLYSIEDGNNYNTGSRLTMKPLAGPMPRRKKPASPPSRSRKATAPAA